MKMKVLLTTDGSEFAEQSIRWFSRLPIAPSSTYEIITVGNYHVYGMVPASVHAEFVRLERAHALESFQRAAAILQEVGIATVHVVSLGQPADEITQYAKVSKTDLIVVGAHGMSLLARMLIGSTSETVARHAPCSVLVVRGTYSPRSFDSEPPRITIATDCSDADSQIAAQVNAIGLPKNSKLQLVSVIEHPYLLEPAFEYDVQITRETSASMERLAKQLESSSSNIEKHVFEKVHVGSCILVFLEKHPTDIIVLGDKGRSAVGRFFLGSVSRSILHHAPCSVLIAKKRLE